MPRRTIRLKGVSLTLEVSDRLSNALRRRLGRATSNNGDSMLHLGGKLPELRLRTRDVEAAVAPYRPRPAAEAPIVVSADDPASIARLRELVQSRYWYHTLELPGGIVTPGEFDHRSLVPHYGLPDDLRGKRALDVATYDGFWAFELERRGAQVTSVDVARIAEYDFPWAARRLLEREHLDKPHHSGFDIARLALGSGVERILSNVYDLNPSTHGTFDFVHVADLLLHLESPTRALRAIRSVTAGTALIVDAYFPELDDGTGRQLVEYLGGWDIVVWWLPSLPTLAQMVSDAGFRSVKLHTSYSLDRTWGGRGLHRAALVAEA